MKYLLSCLMAAFFVSNAQANCFKREDAIKHLETEFGEKAVSMGLASNGLVWEIHVSEKGTWTILENHPSGVVCPVASGDAWADFPQKEDKGS